MMCDLEECWLLLSSSEEHLLIAGQWDNEQIKKSWKGSIQIKKAAICAETNNAYYFRE